MFGGCSIYQVNIHYCLVLLCYCVRDKDHCCVLYDVTRDLLFARYTVHQPNVYQYRALIYLASLRQRLAIRYISCASRMFISTEP